MPEPGSPHVEDVPLDGGRMTGGIVRRGDTVRRPMGSWSPAVHEFLRHLESVGFAGAPRVLGVEGGWEMLDYLDGEVAVDPDWQPGRGHRLPSYARSDAALVGAGELLRDLHAKAASFVPTVVDYRLHPHPPTEGQIVSHGDLGPWNTVYRAGVPVAFIDWDGAQPVDPVVELAAAAWTFVPLQPVGWLREGGFDPVPSLPARLRLFVDAYGLPDRRAILPALTRCRLLGAEGIKYFPVSTTGAAAALERIARDLRWLDGIATDLDAAL
ncbi:MAG: phosphotransferase [Actinopolymorphaceae bacterium]